MEETLEYRAGNYGSLDNMLAILLSVFLSFKMWKKKEKKRRNFRYTKYIVERGGGGGLGDCSPPPPPSDFFLMAIFAQKQVIFRAKPSLDFRERAGENIRQETSAPPPPHTKNLLAQINET